jgi:dihydroneopterin aldolase
MMKFLASVTGPEEAELALEGGADVIDLKDPRRGALGAVSPEVLAATIARVAGRRPVSAVAGDMPMQPAAVREAVAARAAADFVKIGLFPADRDDRQDVIFGLAAQAAATPLIAVFFADGDPDFSLLTDLARAGFHGAMIDTMGKESGGLLKHLSVHQLGDFVAACRAQNLVCGLAGSLEAPDVPRLGVLKPDYLGFRRALTTGRREEGLSLDAVQTIRALIDAEASPAPARAPAAASGARTDRIFVRDFTLDMQIGAYGFERGRTQKVRFSVDASVAPTSSAPSAMADIYSYDLIMDAVRGLVARGHTDLVETLAEDLAEAVLADRRVAAVMVRVEKLELGPAAVGIEIRRP